ncbi:MAG: Proline--tRNA ligase [Bacteroidota bacterium]|jgi:uncharacterized membrane protein YgdD (TMEM256/DUF423 family)
MKHPSFIPTNPSFLIQTTIYKALKNNLFIRLACIFASTAVILGAFGAHALKSVLSESSLKSFQTGVQYQMYHAFALLAAGILQQFVDNPAIKWSGYFFTAGILCFSGSLYILTLLGWRWLGPITPIGGIFFVLGWLSLLFSTKT